MKRLRGLDGLRGIAVGMVLIFHYTNGFGNIVRPHAPGLLFEFPAGAYGVNLFFMISGYVILMTVERTQHLRDFALARFVRLYPPFVVAALFTATILFLSGFNPAHLTAGQAVANLSMATYLFGINQIDSVYWTLSYELLFYLLIAAAMLVLRIKRVELLGLAWLLVAYMVKFVLHVVPPHGVRTAFALPVVTGSEFAYLFVLGMMIRRLHAGERGLLTWGVLGFSTLPILVPLAQVLHGSSAHLSGEALTYSILMVVFAALIYAVPLCPIAPLRKGPLPLLGDISYSLYLIHQMAGYWMIKLLEDRHVGPNLAVALTICLALLLATLMRIFVELPSQHLLRSHRAPAKSLVPVRNGADLHA
jgi:peptidoglycan/LPS O-acetylase OafA/YrhL